jgi:hypothetical protein
MLRIGFDHRRERLLACTGVNNTRMWRMSILILDCFSRHKIQNIHERKRGFISAERRFKMTFNFYTPVQWFCSSLVHIHERTQMDTTRIWIEFVPWLTTCARTYQIAGWTRSSPIKGRLLLHEWRRACELIEINRNLVSVSLICYWDAFWLSWDWLPY